jgi:hypothetical protein
MLKISIYKIDRMGEMTKASIIPSSVGNIASMRHEDKLVDEGLANNKIYATSLDQPISIKGVEKLTYYKKIYSFLFKIF